MSDTVTQRDGALSAVVNREEGEMRGLTLTQPWAEAVASGIKQWETRSWHTPYRGPVAIHAAKGYPREAREFATVEKALGRLAASRVALGAIIAVADLVDIRRADEVALEVSAIERLYGDYSPGRFAWRLENVRRLPEPIGYKGALGLWRIHDADILRALSEGATQ